MVGSRATVSLSTAWCIFPNQRRVWRMPLKNTVKCRDDVVNYTMKCCGDVVQSKQYRGGLFPFNQHLDLSVPPTL